MDAEQDEDQVRRNSYKILTGCKYKLKERDREKTTFLGPSYYLATTRHTAMPPPQSQQCWSGSSEVLQRNVHFQQPG